MYNLSISIESDTVFQFDKLVRLLVREDASGYFRLVVIDVHRIQVLYFCVTPVFSEVMKYTVINGVVKRLNRLYDDVRLCDISLG